MRLRVTACASSAEEGTRLCETAIKRLYESPVAPFIYGVDVTLPEAIIARLTALGKKVATAESCTGGLLAKQLTDVAGASAVTDGGVVSYANAIKCNLLGVSPATIAAHTEVSEEVAGEMARGVAERFGAEIGVSTTGYAGPGGGTDEHPVGTVCFGICVDGKVETYTSCFPGDRERVRALASKYALQLIWEKTCAPKA